MFVLELILTVDIQYQHFSLRRGQVGVGRLADQPGVEMLAADVREREGVDGHSIRPLLEWVVYHDIFEEPRDTGPWSTCEENLLVFN